MLLDHARFVTQICVAKMSTVTTMFLSVTFIVFGYNANLRHKNVMVYGRKFASLEMRAFHAISGR